MPISPSFTKGGAQHEAGVYFAAGAGIANSAGVDAALVLLQFVDYRWNS
jgi:hypothetical protein